MKARSDLELALKRSAHLVVWPTPPGDLADAVLSSLVRKRPHRARRRLILVPAIVLLVLVFVISTDARQAVADLFTTAGVRIGWLADDPTAGADLVLGEEVSLGEASAKFPIHAPRGDDPDAVYSEFDGSFHLVWLGDDQLPAASKTGIARLLSQRSGSSFQSAVKLLPGSATISEVRVLGLPGLWIEGAPHEFTKIDSDGDPIGESSRLAANVLLWEFKGISFRLETTGDLESALEFAERLELAS